MTTDLAHVARRSPVSRSQRKSRLGSPTRQSVAHVAGYCLTQVGGLNWHLSVLTTVLFL